MLLKSYPFKISIVAGVVSNQSVSVEEYCRGYASEKKIARTIRETGFKKLSIVKPGITTADMCFQAVRAMLDNYDIDKNSIGALIFVSQTPDYIAPSTAFVLQKKLGLSHDIVAFDVNLGCPGFVYGLYLGGIILSSLAENKKVLLCCGDVSSHYFVNSTVFAARAISADGAACVLLDRDSEGNGNIFFNIDSYGDKFHSLYVPNGGMKSPRTTVDGVLDQNNPDNFSMMDGLEVLNFTLDEVPKNIETLISFLKIKKEDIDVCLFHQPNHQLIKALQENLGMSKDKVIFNSQNIGNASSASIPLLLTEAGDGWKSYKSKNVLISGFGMGMAVASVVLNLDSTVCMNTMKYVP
ncbi:MAG: ketoacyl-ACP synthase III [Selenomonadaceae bacterium]|nr:ketoacyl-ACP synthase III [Selenomonadaceae bacterium]